MALDVTSCASEREKLQWAFRLYDVDDSGSINLKEITAIMETLDQVRLPSQFSYALPHPPPTMDNVTLLLTKNKAFRTPL